MIESLQLYFDAFKHYSDVQGERRVSYFELMGISWSLHMLYAFYSLFSLYLGVMSFEYFSNSQDFSHLILQSFNFTMQKISLFSILFGVIFYPFIFQFAFKFWKGLFKFYAHLFENKVSNLDDLSEEILSSAFSANLFLIFPVIGKFLSHLAMIFFLFQGLKKKCQFSSLQATLVLITPLFLLFLIAIFSASYFMLLFALM